MRKLIQVWLSLIFSIMAAILVAPALAQPVNAPNAYVRVTPGSGTTSTLYLFAPGNPTPKSKQDFPIYISYLFSPNTQWIANYGLKSTAGGDSLFSYGKVGTNATELPVDHGFASVAARFSGDSRYLAYTWLNFQGKQWILGIIDLQAGGKPVEFTGKLADPLSTPEPGVFSGAAFPIGFSADDKTLYISGFIFGAAQGLQGLYALDLSGANFTNGSCTELPAVKTVLQKDVMSGSPVLSPDGMRLIYAFNDPKNPPENFTPGQFSHSANTLYLYDVAQGQSRVIAQADKGQGIELAAWSPDGKTLYYTTGGYNQTPYIVSPHIFTVDMGTGKTTQGPALEPDPKQNVQALLVCSDSIFFTTKAVTDPPDPQAQSTLYSAPIKDFAARSKPLITGQSISLLGCAPA